ncbi:hypothetical protein [Dactylosporangium sp. NPDC000521]|uniref:hypothetical protein n=1 Tax=Dactylosporangium sp. NPDC000521 TaxID=3363975 RepID=UPI00368B72E3
MNADLERRLRSTLAAQAARVTPERLRPAVPPTALPARGPAFILLQRAAWVAAILLLVAVVIVTLRPAASDPQQPPTVVPPSPSGSYDPTSPPTSSPPSPSPSRSLSHSLSPSPAALSGDGGTPSPGHVVTSPGIRSSAP